MGEFKEKDADVNNQRYIRFMAVIDKVCELAGYKLEETIVVRDVRSGKIIGKE